MDGLRSTKMRPEPKYENHRPLPNSFLDSHRNFDRMVSGRVELLHELRGRRLDAALHLGSPVLGKDIRRAGDGVRNLSGEGIGLPSRCDRCPAPVPVASAGPLGVCFRQLFCAARFAHRRNV